MSALATCCVESIASFSAQLAGEVRPGIRLHCPECGRLVIRDLDKTWRYPLAKSPNGVVHDG